MRHSLALLLTFALIGHAWAQAPLEFNYQAILRDPSGLVLPSSTATLRIALLQGSENGPVVYDEEHDVTTNAYGLVNVSIGSGQPLSGSMASIDWSTGLYYVRTSIDGTVMGTAQL